MTIQIRTTSKKEHSTGRKVRERERETLIKRKKNRKTNKTPEGRSATKVSGFFLFFHFFDFFDFTFHFSKMFFLKKKKNIFSFEKGFFTFGKVKGNTEYGRSRTDQPNFSNV